MKRTALNILIAATTLAGMAQAQAPQKVHDLAEARKVFRQADRNGDAHLSPLELRAAGYTGSKATGVDHDGDQRISEREFYVAFRKQLAAEGKTIGADLDAEVTRELAKRRAAEARKEAERRKEAAKEQAKKDAEARRKGTERIQKAGDKADERAEAQKRIDDARRKAQQEAERRRKDATKEKKEHPKTERPQPRPRRIGG